MAQKGRSTGWGLILSSCRHRWRGITLGVLFGLGWTAGKVSVGLLRRSQAVSLRPGASVQRPVFQQRPGTAAYAA